MNLNQAEKMKEKLIYLCPEHLHGKIGFDVMPIFKRKRYAYAVHCIIGEKITEKTMELIIHKNFDIESMHAVIFTACIFTERTGKEVKAV